jgi:glycosyltransferase involved in cell wall biosynthesis
MWKNGRDEVRRIIAEGNASRDRGDWATAAAAYKQAVDVRPDLFATWVQLGNMLKEDRQFDESQAAYLEALRLVPDNADAHLMYGHLLKITNRLEEAAAHYHLSAILDAARPDARLELIGLAKQGVKGAQFRSSPSRTWSLNAKLAATRTHLSEVLTDLKRREALRPSARAVQSSGYLCTLNAAYDAIMPLMRSINGMSASNEVTTDLEGTASAGAEKCAVVFDSSDLIQFFRHHRLPTGIQRVQMQVICFGLLRAGAALDVKVCCFNEADDYWHEVSPAQFIDLCELSLISNDWTAPDWVTAIAELDATLRASPNFGFPRGAYLVNMGTSWWLQNYFLYVREAKIRHNVKYVPFVHDMIPIMTPEHCVIGLTQDFISWVLGVFLHADFYLVNSEATRKDLHDVAGRLGHEVTDDCIRTVRLDADFRKGKDVAFDPSVLLSHRLRRNEYVLFVSTIESRKNHLAAFGAWVRLCRAHGAENVPKLVCVGYRGWLNEPVYAKLSASVDLRDKVLMLSGVPDKDLAVLYQSCLFTLFPSSYEGWGLPVTESLCYGKVPLISNSSSLPEAGGEFADYFELGDENRLLETLERLIFDAQYRRRREALIRQRWRPRNWEDVADDIIGALEGWRRTHDLDCANQTLFRPVATLGRYYGLNRNTEVKICPSMASGEIFRAGNAWWGSDDCGCWTKPAPARMVIGVAEGAGRYRLYLGLRSAPEKDTPYDVTVSNCPTLKGVIKSDKTKWLWFDLEIGNNTNPVVDIVLEGYETGSSRPREEEEPRTVALGVIGFMLCRQDDATARANFIEAVVFDSLDLFSKVL